MAQSIFFVLANDSVKLVLALKGFLKAEDEVLFVTFYLITLGYSRDYILQNFKWSDGELSLHFIKLEKLKLIELYNGQRKLQVSPKARWTQRGPLQPPQATRFFFNYPPKWWSSKKKGLCLLTSVSESKIERFRLLFTLKDPLIHESNSPASVIEQRTHF
jgi:hypothetical protein